MNKHKRPIKAIEVIIITTVVLCLATIIGLGYVIAHFVSKFW